jgi:hypothetical protein
LDISTGTTGAVSTGTLSLAIAVPATHTETRPVIMAIADILANSNNMLYRGVSAITTSQTVMISHLSQQIFRILQ